jgi:hypothetical protein
MSTSEYALRLWNEAIDRAGPYGLDPAYLFVVVLLAGTMVAAPPERASRWTFARLALPSVVTVAVWVLGALFRQSGHEPAGKVVYWSILGLAGAVTLASPWIVWRAGGHRVLASGLLAFQLCFTLSMSAIAAMSVVDDWT